MIHSNLTNKYYKAQDKLAKKKYKSARMLFYEIIIEITGSDTDSTADINLSNSAEECLNEINSILEERKLKQSSRKYIYTFSFLLILAIVVILIMTYSD